MSLIDAQKWLNQRLDIDEPLYAVLAQLERDGDTQYRMVAVIEGKPALETWLSDADWMDYDTARDLADDLIGESCRISDKPHEITRAFIVEKGKDYRVIEEVDHDAPEL